MRAVLLTLIAGCSSSAPEPPTALEWDTHEFSLSDKRVLVIDHQDAVQTDGTPVELPMASSQDGSSSSNEPVPLELPAITRVASGKRHACALSFGHVYCWGDAAHGELGDTYCPSGQPSVETGECAHDVVALPALEDMESIAAGDDVTCTVDSAGKVYCWGDREGGRLGGSIVPQLDDPTPVELPFAVTRVVITSATVCALGSADGGAYCWGHGYGATPKRLDLEGVVDLAIGRTHTCAITKHGLACWGSNRNGESGDVAAAYQCGTEAPTCNIGVTSIPLDATRVVVGERHSCALTADGGVWCWGSNEVGQLGRDDAFLVGKPELVFDRATAIAASYSRACALRNDLTVWCWGEYGSALSTEVSQ